MAVAVPRPFIEPLMCPRRRGLGLRSFDLVPALVGPSQAGGVIDFQVVPQSGPRFSPCAALATAASSTARYEETHKMAEDLLQRLALSTTRQQASCSSHTPRAEVRASRRTTEAARLATGPHDVSKDNGTEQGIQPPVKEIISSSLHEQPPRANVGEVEAPQEKDAGAEAVAEACSPAVAPAIVEQVHSSQNMAVATAEIAIQTTAATRKVVPPPRSSLPRKEKQKNVAASAAQTPPLDAMGPLNPGVGPLQRPRPKLVQGSGQRCATSKQGSNSARGRRGLEPEGPCTLFRPHGKATSVPPECRCKASDDQNEASAAAPESSFRAPSLRRRRWSSGARSSSCERVPDGIPVVPLVRLATRAHVGEAESTRRGLAARGSATPDGELWHVSKSSSSSKRHDRVLDVDSREHYCGRPPQASPQPSSPRQVPRPAAPPSTAAGSLEWATSPTGHPRELLLPGNRLSDEPKSFAEVSLKWEQKARESCPLPVAPATTLGTEKSAMNVAAGTLGPTRRPSSAVALGLDQATVELEALVEDAHRALVRDGLFPPFESDVVEDGPISIPSLDAVDRALEELQRGLAEIDSALARPRA
mmetsp:Transcript_45597/g.102327  ORF Transcript_45597/g.102327 Transcript_45597/m.102327 type:complete len:590 (+) Transcript_45597:50-1819(+)